MGGGVKVRRHGIKGQRRGVKVRPDAGWGGIKGLWNGAKLRPGTLSNNGDVVMVDGEALDGDAWRFKGEEKALKTKEFC